MLESLGLFASAARCAIGGYLVWIWLDEGQTALWGWASDRKPLELSDAIAVGLCLVGITVVMWSPQS